ncbi:PTS fructose transporter subunit IIABC [Clostridium saccharobutylicum]|uniref:FruA: PTS system fructose-specific EIIABC component n=1 Tax=Clostridium saccharobutylicum DSM 13864 TaxID=1345695 RepID=U5MRP5_CLOSA|nr:PTS fructose transporter subunit IIABC [Clostridium saccharobutylicum]AGX43193.1 fruA: PTS system fructose-specific EIIABC component [Clostridium saccharobutylicum DSM 13864]AQR90492.1 PTS system fructose-specific EIIABC component [Clostridium saccharobutylicum]AQS00398.1 PTS system fructose-specific EIIABC component [Clostridium saccharobutylicum]AQS14381.1 PTS system fructose-specific EIIABC component [Clostridium saccharobutylicum]MBA2906666.1 PTS system fructose-specific IIC component [
MKIVDLLHKQGINLNISPASKNECINELVDLMDKTGNLNNKEEYKKAILAREELSTTGIGDGIAIPHGKTKAVKQASLAAAVSKKGVDYDSLDGMPAHLFFMIAVPDNSDNLHLEVLARLSTILMDESFRTSLINCTDKDEFLRLIDEKEAEKFPDEPRKEASVSNDGYRVLAVTACPTGIAHTYMAAESLENKGKEMGVSIKVETNGSGGAKNVLTKEEIKNAECIIIAADKNVEMARFDGKRVIKTKVADGIHKATELIEKATNGSAPIYHHEGGSEDNSEIESEGIGRQIYKHLMNGVSHMLPFVIGGGILIALAFLFDTFNPANPSGFGSGTPLAAFFMKVGGSSFGFMLPILAGYIAMSIADRPGLAVGFVGGFIAKEGITFASAFDPKVAVVSGGFLGALFAGFLAGYLVLALKKIFNALPETLEGLKPTLLYPVFGILLVGLIMIAVNPFFGAINTGLTNGLNSMGGTSKVLLGIVVAGMMAIDMGGPFNKAAYVFGTASLSASMAAGNQNGFLIMAAVMAGGMVPPLAIALCTTFFGNRFTENERKSGITNYIMGLSFITEGAIPFAAADPIRVIPSCIVGSATAGAISMLFNCTLMAPHGGIFVVPVIGNPFGYIAAVVIGAIVGMIIMAILKKPIRK